MNLFVLLLMQYLVALIDHGNVRHKWIYDESNLHNACRQLESLLEAFIEVNEVQPILIKVTPQESTLPLINILSSYVYKK